jgi:hypothetical protein
LKYFLGLLLHRNSSSFLLLLSTSFEINFLLVYRFAGGRQPKQPIPPGDSAFFYHGLCVATSSTGIATVSSHSCKLNICLGGGGFNCIAFYSGTSFVFNLEPQLGFLLFSSVDDTLDTNGKLSLPPPFPATIIGGTGRYVNFEV